MSKLIKLYTLRYAFYYMSIIDNAVKKQNTTTALIKGLSDNIKAAIRDHTIQWFSSCTLRYFPRT